MRCPVCDSTDKWKNVDQYRLAPKGMHICEGCGFVSYPAKYKTEEEIRRYYEKDYRACPNVNNAFTGQKKLHIHSAFLTDTLKGWQERGLTKPVVADVGAAYGLFLNWIRGHFPEADLNGTEYALAYRRNAYWEYGIKLDLEFDQSKKYDLISSFKVAEHQLDVDLRLREYALALKDDGVLYISVPLWFQRMSNFGADGFDLEYYYDPNHINVWTREHFEAVLAKAGLEIIKVDEWMYDTTYLCKRNDEMMKKTREFTIEFIQSIVNRMKSIKEAFMRFGAGDFEGAIKTFPNFPTAWLNLYEMRRASAHKQNDGQMPFEHMKETVLDPALAACPFSLDIIRLWADVLMRYDKYKEAADVLQQGLEKRPNNAPFLMALSHCFREIALRAKDPDDRIKMFAESRDCCRYLRDIDLQMRNDCVNWIYRDNSELPTPHEGVNHG